MASISRYERAGVANLPFPVHSHILRHAFGFALANTWTDTGALQAYLGHLSIHAVMPSWHRGGSRTC